MSKIPAKELIQNKIIVLDEAITKARFRQEFARLQGYEESAVAEDKEEKFLMEFRNFLRELLLNLLTGVEYE